MKPQKYFVLPDDARPTHVYIAGKPGQGKSSLMHSMALQDIRKGKGVAVLDPNGDLVESLLNWIPESRMNDCIYLDGENSVPIEILGWETPRERERVAKDAVQVFKRLLSDDWSSRMDLICHMAVGAVLEAREPFTSIQDMLNDEDKRFRILERVTSPDILKFWTNDFPSARNKGTAIYPRDAAAPIITRLSPILRDSTLFELLSARNPRLKMADVINGQKILLVNLKKMDEDAAKIFGSLMVSQIQKILFKRDGPASDRTPFFLYIDEFQDFRTDIFPKLLAQGRKFNLCACLANQHPIQINDIVDDIKGCISSYIFFRMDADHARVFASAIRPNKPELLETFSKFEALYHDAHNRVTVIRTPRPAGYADKSYAEYIKKLTIREYACKPPQMPHDESNVHRSTDEGCKTLLPDRPKGGNTGKPGKARGTHP